ncbi:MAG TPA: YebC/PmpR family DNA-binding transcriptional regulator [Candidatus Krumholzibacteria bacterium]|nr:YebC/PmpR family DNA-binding transcriptional regulator [Candidatus Krumholzibacteria bacterium]HPD73161.1 YebC/PmpR family DNA-binding transcriptional regulator [Candidatus Krumholzibacteria bacterium]HRY41961.1 YebC/PmpR family DNA-binding transcriptional regulator [Candidatus Krumholzibacteria bacterium]
MGRAFEYRRAAKEKRWDKMSKLFPKLAKSITVAAKKGGADPEMNAPLRTAILNAKAQNMPKDNIEAAIRRASGKDAADITEINYEGKGPHGVLIFIECATDNTTRTVANVRSYFNRCGGQLLPTGSLEFLFDRKAVFEFARPAGVALDELELALIDAGLQEMVENAGTLYVYGDYTDFGSLAHALEAQGVEVAKAGLQRIPQSPQECSEAEMQEIEKLLDRIEDDDDVQAVYTNIA